MIIPVKLKWAESVCRQINEQWPPETKLYFLQCISVTWHLKYWGHFQQHKSQLCPESSFLDKVSCVQRCIASRESDECQCNAKGLSLQVKDGVGTAAQLRSSPVKARTHVQKLQFCATLLCATYSVDWFAVLDSTENFSVSGMGRCSFQSGKASSCPDTDFLPSFNLNSAARSTNGSADVKRRKLFTWLNILFVWLPDLRNHSASLQEMFYMQYQPKTKAGIGVQI